MKEKKLIKYGGGYALTIDSQIMKALNIGPETRLLVETIDGAIKITPVKEKFKVNTALIKERKLALVDELREYVKSLNVVGSEKVSDEKLNQIKKRATQIAYSDSAPLSKYEQGILLEAMLDEIFGFGPLTPFFKDPEIDNPIEMTLDGSFYANGKRLEIEFDSVKHKLEMLERIQKMPEANRDDLYVEYKVGGARRIRIPLPEYLE